MAVPDMAGLAKVRSDADAACKTVVGKVYI
jgi:hypothetical protein